jgi:hypothetical protein
MASHLPLGGKEVLIGKTQRERLYTPEEDTMHEAGGDTLQQFFFHDKNFTTSSSFGNNLLVWNTFLKRHKTLNPKQRENLTRENQDGTVKRQGKAQAETFPPSVFK